MNRKTKQQKAKLSPEQMEHVVGGNLNATIDRFLRASDNTTFRNAVNALNARRFGNAGNAGNAGSSSGAPTAGNASG